MEYLVNSLIRCKFFFATFLLVTFLSFQSWVKADDIRDFEIEGISIGDNALNFYSKSFIDDIKDFYPGSKEFFRATIEFNEKENQFSSVQLHMKIEEGNYIVYSISGLIYFDRNDSKSVCLNKRKKIVDDISSILINTKKSKPEINIYNKDKTGNSSHDTIYFDFNPDQSEYAKVGCVFYGDEFYKKTKWPNHLRLAFTSSEFHYWLLDEAYN